VTVTRSTSAQTIRATGVVGYDESRLTDVNLKVEGWIRDLFVDVTGQPVTKGQPLFTLYSPEILSTESEYLLAVKTRDQMQESQLAEARQRADALVTSARRRLALWDLSPQDLQALEQGRQPQPVVTFRSPASGVVLDKQALKGSHVMPGQTLYRIADLSVVWVEAAVSESDLSLVRVGGSATVSFDAYPGEFLTGRVLYVYPYIDPQTRTNKVRYVFANRGGRLKPGMFATIEVHAPGTSGLSVPSDAVLDTGPEQIVFVAHGDGYFQPRRVRIGRRFGGQTLILEGLKAGDHVAAGATFLLDSESQLRAGVQDYGASDSGAAGAATSATGRAQLAITLKTQPDPPKAGDNQFEVTLADTTGQPIADAQVSLQLSMPAMPTMNMPAMRSEVKLQPAGGGVYRGTGEILTAGRWDVTVAIDRSGQRAGAKALVLVAR